MQRHSLPYRVSFSVTREARRTFAPLFPPSRTPQFQRWTPLPLRCRLSWNRSTGNTPRFSTEQARSGDVLERVWPVGKRRQSGAGHVGSECL